MKILSTKWFRKWSKKSNLNGSGLIEAIKNLEGGLSTAALGSNLFKVRVKKENAGKSSGFRTIVIYKKGNRAVFLYGFAKNERDNINSSELEHFQKLGNDLLALNKGEVRQLIGQKVLFEVEGEK